jgi:hypothetical protein
MFSKKYSTGVILDKRSQEDKNKDFNHDEIAFSPTINLVTKEEALKQTTLWERYNQAGTSSCVAHSVALAYGIKRNFFKGSPMSVYRPRSNYPGEGMIADDASKIVKNLGIADFVLLPTPSTEKEANALTLNTKVVEDALKNKADAYVYITSQWFNNIASIASQGTPVTIFIYSTYREWAVEYPTLRDKPKLGSAPIQHAITVLPNSVYEEDGKRYLIIQDSALFGGYSIRHLSEDFINARCYFGQYFTKLTVAPIETKPKHTFTRSIKYGERSKEVEWLQMCLVNEGIHPKEAVTGNFFGITLNSVKKFQLKYADDVLKPIGLKLPTGFVGAMTIKKLNELYS